MFQIRRSTFETNSSSTHAVCISAVLDDSQGSLQYHKNIGEIDFELGKFCWDFRDLDMLDSKASYLYTTAVMLAKSEHESNQKYCLENIKDVWRDWFAKLGITAVFEEPDTKQIEYSDGYKMDDFYIDHQGLMPKFLDLMITCEDSFLRYLFNFDSFVLMGHDNTCRFKVKIDVDYKHQAFYSVED